MFALTISTMGKSEMTNILHDVSWVVPYRNDTLTAIFEAFTWLGYPTFVMFFLPLGYWLWNKNAFTRLAVIVILSTVLNAFLKDLWQNPRPPAEFRLDPEVGKSFGMPSGHAQVSAVLWFWLASEIRKPWAWIVAIVLVTGIAFSRIYLGIHDLEDILAGLGIAAATVFIYQWAQSAKLDGFRALPLWAHIVVLAAAQLVVMFAWPEARYSFSASILFALLIGWIIGAHWERKFINFEIRSEIWATPVVALLGIAGLMLLDAALKPALAFLSPEIAGNLRLILAGIYMTAGAPYLFKLFRLSKTS